MISSGLRPAVATAALVFISGYYPVGSSHEYRIYAERGTRHRLPDREGNYHSRSVSALLECADQRLQSKNQSRTGARVERVRSAAIGRFADEESFCQRQIRRLRRARHEVQAPLLQHRVWLLEVFEAGTRHHLRDAAARSADAGRAALAHQSTVRIRGYRKGGGGVKS